MGFIYKITNDVNGKIYVGKTELSDPNDRWKEHLQDYKKQRCEKRPLYAAMKKYGTDHFHFEVIEEIENTEEREKYWINELRTYVGFDNCNGYNATLGGDGKKYLNLNEDEVTKYHIEEATYTLNKTAKYFSVDRETIKKILNKNNVFWLKGSAGRKIENYINNGAYLKVDPCTNLILDIYVTSEEAALSINKECEKHIINAANGLKGSHYAYGYLWYKDLNFPKKLYDIQYKVKDVDEYEKYCREEVYNDNKEEI